MGRSLLLSVSFTFLFSLFAGVLTAAPRLYVDSASVHFGNVTLGSFKDVDLTISDSSDADATIADILGIGGTSSDYATLSPSTFPAIVPAHGSLTIRVRFTPQATGFRTTALEIRELDTALTVFLIGTGTVENSGVSFSVGEIDMGIVAPDMAHDTVIKLYSTGTDSATISGVFTANGGGDTSFTAYLLNDEHLPFRLAPGDSVSILVRFTGLLPTGPKQALLSVIAGTHPAIKLTGDVEWGLLHFQPESIDFGPLYYGESRDSVVYLVNDGLTDIDINSIEPPFGSVFFLDTPSVPFVLHSNDSVALRVRANPGPSTYNTPDMDAYSPNAQPGTPKGFFIVVSKGFALEAPHRQVVTFYCAKPSATIDFAVPVNDTVPVAIPITLIKMTDPTLSISSDRSLSDTIPAFGSHTFPLHLPPSDAKDTMVVEFYSGLHRIITDTLLLLRQPSIAQAAIVPTKSLDSVQTSLEIRTQTGLSDFNVDTLIVHLTVSDTNAFEIDPNTFALPASMLDARIIRIDREKTGYTLWIASSTLFTGAEQGSVVSFNAHRFVSAGASTSVSVTLETPERGECLQWTDATLSVPMLPSCGAAAENELMAGQQISFSVRIKDNPVIDGDLALVIQSPSANSAQIVVRNALGEVLIGRSESLKVGLQSLNYYTANLRSGTYFVIVILADGRTATLKFSKL